jgi:hypothetical protein
MPLSVLKFIIKGCSKTSTFKQAKAREKEFGEDQVATLQVAPEDCTGCELRGSMPGKERAGKLKAINMAPQRRCGERENWNYFLTLPELDRRVQVNTVRFADPAALFEFSVPAPVAVKHRM